MKDTDIEFSQLPAKNGQIGLITLRRPQALNALTMNMCLAIDEHLIRWERDSDIKMVLIRGEGERAFCAGGDVRWVYEIGQNDPDQALEFFRHEYRMNRRLFYFPKPYIAFMHGITMGGGLGISVHGSHRVAAESLVLAMPETGIGFYPDIGASYFLPRCPGKLGLHLGLTGERINAYDAAYLGLVDFVIGDRDIPTIIEQFTELRFDGDVHAQVSQLLKNWQLSNHHTELIVLQKEINDYYSAATMREILQRLQKAATPQSKHIMALLQNKSPTSLKITLELLNRGSKQDFDACMNLEYKLTQLFLNQDDFYEGIRAAVVDKDRKPRWQPSTLEEVEDNLLSLWLK